MNQTIVHAALSCAFVFSVAAGCQPVVASPITSGPAGSGGTTTGPGTGGSSAVSPGVGGSGAGASGSGGGGSGAGTGTGTGGSPASCSPADRAARWAKMVQTPITLPGKAGLLDLSGTGNQGLTIGEAEQILCPGTKQGPMSDGTEAEYWGDNGEVWLDYPVATMKVSLISLWPGYAGTLDFKGPNGTNTYRIPIGSRILKNGSPITLDWSDASGFPGELDELCRGLMATFTTAPLDPAGTTCIQSGKCVWGTFGDIGFVNFKPVGLAVWVASISAPQPEPGIPNRLDLSMP